MYKVILCPAKLIVHSKVYTMCVAWFLNWLHICKFGWNANGTKLSVNLMRPHLPAGKQRDSQWLQHAVKHLSLWAHYVVVCDTWQSIAVSLAVTMTPTLSLFKNISSDICAYVRVFWHFATPYWEHDRGVALSHD